MPANERAPREQNRRHTTRRHTCIRVVCRDQQKKKKKEGILEGIRASASVFLLLYPPDVSYINDVSKTDQSSSFKLTGRFGLLVLALRMIKHGGRHTEPLTLEVRAQHFLSKDSVVEDSECGARAGPGHDGRCLVLTRHDTGAGGGRTDDDF